MHKEYIVKLKNEERLHLKKLISRGTEKARKLTRCRILLMADEQKTDNEIASALKVSMNTIFRLRHRYAAEGLKSALNEEPRSGRPSIFDGKQQARITALACSTPPKGRGRWTLRLIADKAVELKFVDDISHDTVKRILKKTNLSLI